MSEAAKRPWRAIPSKVRKGVVGILDDDDEPICYCDNPAQPNGANVALIVRAVNAYDDLLAACERYEAALVAVLGANPDATVNIGIGLQVVEARDRGHARFA